MNLSERFGSLLTPDERKGYSGWIVKPADLLSVFKTLRDELQYGYLTSLTSVDYIAEGKFEVVYHLSSISGGEPLVLKADVPRENPVLPSVVSLYPGAELQEREVYDLMGITFEGHPDLRRVLLWEGFAGHPLRKDWREAYYEEDAKPFGSRWPAGQAYRAEEKNPFHANVKYPDGFSLDGFQAEEDAALYRALEKGVANHAGEIHTEKMTVNLGPQHPSTHGVFRMAVLLDGETVLALKPVMGYLHRNHEKIGERTPYLGMMPYTDRMDYLTSPSNNFGYALAVEKLMGIKPPERAEYIRIIMAELTRISSHIWAIGFLLNDLGAYFTPALYTIEERELIIDLFEEITGSRMMCNYLRFGGVARDITADQLRRIKLLVEERLPKKVDELDAYLTKNEILMERCIGVGLLPKEKAIALSVGGPVLRASGVPYDIRKADPYSIYDRFQWNVVSYNGCDVYDRYLVRLGEIRESINIVKQALRDIPGGEFFTGKPQYQVRVPAGEAYSHVEGPKGELGFYIVSDGKLNPYRYHVRAPSFINLTAMEEMCRGGKVADSVAVLGSVDIVLGETDR